MMNIINTWPLDIHQNESSLDEKERRMQAQENGELYSNGTLSFDNEYIHYETKSSTFTAPLKEITILYRRKNRPLPVVHDFFIVHNKHRYPLAFPDNTVETERDCVNELKAHGVHVQYDFKYLIKDALFALLLLGIFAFIIWYF